MNKEMKSVVTTGVGLGVVALILAYFVYSLNGEVTLLTEEISAIDSEIQRLSKKASPEEFEEKTKTLNELKDALKEYVKILPSSALATEEVIIAEFTNYAKRADVKLLEIVGDAEKGGDPGGRGGRRRRGGGQKNKDDFEKVNVSFRIEATFENFVRFLGFLEGHQSFLQVDTFNLSTIKGKDQQVDRLSVALAVSTFRYDPSAGKKK